MPGKRCTGAILKVPNCHRVRPRGDWAPGQQVLDDFVVEGTLGEGGMGKVYLLHSRSTTSRFAVKRAKGLREADRRNFLAELQTWIDLPEHANLVPCRFFRTMGNEILIFAEYVEGGSLQEWIDSRRLYEGGLRQALERMLDVAIQFAWGLSCLHELGLIHQDVKPGNMLIRTEGKTSLQGVQSRVTDFGLVRARAAGGETTSSDPRRSILVSTFGGTPAYWSPEQAARMKLTRKRTSGPGAYRCWRSSPAESTWNSGLCGGRALEQHLRNGAHDNAIPAIPDRLADLLRRCFRQEPSERLASLSEAVNQLKAIYQESVGAGYNRTLQGIERTVSRRPGSKSVAAYTAPRGETHRSGWRRDCLQRDAIRQKRQRCWDSGELADAANWWQKWRHTTRPSGCICAWFGKGTRSWRAIWPNFAWTRH